jgi:hypothetical protein
VCAVLRSEGWDLASPEISEDDIMKNPRLELPIPRPALSLAFFFLALASYVPGTAHATYGMHGSLSMSTEGGPSISRDIPWAARIDISDSETSVGGAGNTASITSASISASASAQNALHEPGPPPDYWFANASMSTSLNDDLRFTIPAGSYPSGLYAAARVHVEGSVAASGDAAASHTYDILFGENASASTVWPAPPVSLDVDLAAELVAPGVTLSTPTTVVAPFVASVLVSTNAPGEVAQSSSSDIACRVICLSVPPGVTWVSDSGTFGAPNCSAAVPGLEDWAVAGLALTLAAAALWIARSMRPELA